MIKNREMISEKKFNSLLKEYEQRKLEKKYFFTFSLSKEISDDNSALIFNKFKKIILHDIQIDKIFEGLIIAKNNNVAFINSFIKNKKVSYVVKFNNQYVEFIFNINSDKLTITKNFIHSSKLNIFNRFLVKNEAKSELKRIFKYLNI